MLLRISGLTCHNIFPSRHFQPAIKFLRKSMKEIVETVDGQLVFSLLKILDCFFTPFIPKEVTVLFMITIFSFSVESLSVNCHRFCV